MVFGAALIGLGVAVILLDIYWANPDSPLLSAISLRVIPHNIRAILLGAVGTGILAYAVIRMNRALLAPYVAWGGDRRSSPSAVELDSQPFCEA